MGTNLLATPEPFPPGPSLSHLPALAEADGLAMCPLCHTEDATITNAAIAAGSYWQCARCGQLWDAVRLATVAAYAVWVAGRVT